MVQGLTFDIQFQDLELCTRLLQQSLGGFAVWAVRFREDHDRVLIDVGLSLCFDVGRNHFGRAAEQATK